MERVAVYPGTFDPITFGHMDVINRALELFDKLIIGVSTHPNKIPLFSLEERKKLVADSVKGLSKAEVDSFDGLLVDFCKKKHAATMIRGLRALSDFESEFQRATINRKLSPNLDTVFVMTSDKFFYLNSSIVKELALFGGKIDCLVPKHVEKALKQKLKK
ncbi:MAG: pantetheine-phosphate adenylyltransferase [Candidatus Diapherotrites archaeon]|nr:pantetheine-phosphate adenylyltransferase [Candidatus Diapherotrites archaeon]